MPADYYFDAYNGETGERLSLRETGRRELYYVMRMIMSVTELEGYPCTSTDWYWQDSNFYKQLGYESPEDYALDSAKDTSDKDYVAWSGSIDLEKIWEWFEKFSPENELELIEEKENSSTEDEDLDNLKEELDSNSKSEYIDPYRQLKMGFKLALETKGHVTMLFAY